MKSNSTGSKHTSSQDTLDHAAFPISLSLSDVLARYWFELKKILPADEVHIVDPYMLDSGGADAATYAGNVTSLLSPAVRGAKRLVFVHGKAGPDLGELLDTDIATLNPSIDVLFTRGSAMHSRYVIADRARALGMEFSFNRIGKSFGTVSLVDDPSDLAGILGELQRLTQTSPKRGS
ncbi:hypothetical protein [Demequina oxidasica]|uniref:hypothetical protein n=1 Tax=Demequina oxidasica TaxID=676199 RepID=UPI0007833A8B|nr:hypothetical protein [Demequina oxidasica]